MINNDLLQKAREKSKNSNLIKDYDYKEDSMENFILRIYNHCIPASYGKKFQKKLIHDQKDILRGIMDNTELGDICLSYPNLSENRLTYYDEFEECIKVFDPNRPIWKCFFEVKISYLSGGHFNIRNIRSHQNFNYFLLCFVDSKDDFKPYFIVVDKFVITANPHIFKLYPMNGTKKANENNTKIGYGTTVEMDSDKMDYLLSRNELLGTSYEDLKDFLKNTYDDSKQQYYEHYCRVA